jgi:hypothetical protein
MHQVQPGGEPAAGVPGAVDCIADADDLKEVVPAAKWFLLLHSAIISPMARGLGNEVQPTCSIRNMSERNEAQLRLIRKAIAVTQPGRYSLVSVKEWCS